MTPGPAGTPRTCRPVGHRLGLSQAPFSASKPGCKCAGRLSRPDHAMTRPLTKSTMTPRHAMLTGAWCRISQRARVATSQETTPALRHSVPQHDRTDRGDVLFMLPDVHVVGAVSVTRPAADTYVVAAACEHGAAAARRDRDKRRKHDMYGEAQDYSFVPFVVPWRRTGTLGARRWRYSPPWRTCTAAAKRRETPPSKGGVSKAGLCKARCASWPSRCARAMP
jgi:hypothetical protein